MTKPLGFWLAVALMGWAAPSLACDLGSVCWTDLSGGTATTELRFRAQGGERTAVIEAGRTTFRFVEMVKDSPLLPSDWLCVQGRQRNVAGVYSDWFISDKEGVCNQTTAVMPPAAPDPVTPPIEPPPVVPPPVQPPPASPLTAVTVKGNDLTFDYKLAACPKGIQMKSGKIINGSRTVTMTCRK